MTIVLELPRGNWCRTMTQDMRQSAHHTCSHNEPVREYITPCEICYTCPSLGMTSSRVGGAGGHCPLPIRAAIVVGVPCTCAISPVDVGVHSMDPCPDHRPIRMASTTQDSRFTTWGVRGTAWRTKGTTQGTRGTAQGSRGWLPIQKPRLQFQGPAPGERAGPVL